MKIIIVENSEEFGKAAFNEVYKVVKNNPSATLGLATGSTPLPLYAEMVKDHRDRTSGLSTLTNTSGFPRRTRKAT